ncbi:MAG: hypothetical protein CVV25_02270 [Ignavibacteriae bacterium HGW-Ignavibacteriae-4]|jgi:hypothetical protein|nr:MAG: hypothetical protein CVV25_02270 [Ignavibacteriae bacterium HGW-Ignavibacteriae-4]
MLKFIYRKALLAGLASLTYFIVIPNIFVIDNTNEQLYIIVGKVLMSLIGILTLKSIYSDYKHRKTRKVELKKR